MSAVQGDHHVAVFVAVVLEHPLQLLEVVVVERQQVRAAPLGLDARTLLWASQSIRPGDVFSPSVGR